jgi:hypothetical protein
MSVDSFTSTVSAVSSSSGTLTFVVAASEYNERGFYVKIDPTGVTVTKATSFGGSQAALSFPVTRQEAKSLALSMLRVAN